jgi:dTDP-4-amino-4,6-dideoxygalactose transaminase
MINVTKSFLPPIETYHGYLKRIWEKSWLTNNGPLLLELENKLKTYLGVKNLFFCTNGTIALQIAIKALEISGEIITTPFSYVATVNSIIWENCTPVFVDINEIDFNINVNLLESKITSKTKAFLFTHVFGNACDIDAIDKIAKKFNLPVIYDGAHAFNSKFNAKQLLSFGDISTCSLHATKLFHSGEGGLIITENDVLAEKIRLIRQFGHEGDDYYCLGINGKNSEFHAAMGLSVFGFIDHIAFERAKIVDIYNESLDFTKLKQPKPAKECLTNYSYYPVVFESEELVKKVIKKLREQQIVPRRYFYPSLNTLPHVEYTSCEVSEKISKTILALPLFVGLKVEDVKKICNLINATI